MKMFQIPEIGSLTWSEVSYEAILKSRTLIKLLKVIKAFQEDYRNLIIIVFIADSAALSTNTVRKKWCHFPWCRNCHYKLAVQLIFIANNVNELQFIFTNNNVTSINMQALANIEALTFPFLWNLFVVLFNFCII